MRILPHPTRVALLAGIAFALGSTFSPAHATTRMFDSWMGFSTGEWGVASAYYPTAIALADLNGDGELDAAVANAGNFIAPKMSVLLNGGHGMFEAPVFYRSAYDEQDVAAADFDGDGDVDLVVSDTGDYGEGTTVSVFLNNGDGSFGAARLVTAAKGPAGLAVADFDGDGDVDIAAAGYGYIGQGKTISLLANAGDATFATAVVFQAGASPNRIAAADVNADGRADVIVANDAQMNVLLNDGAGGFAPRVSYGTAQSASIRPSITVADVDKDGDLDVVYGGGTAAASLFRNQGAGTFAPAQLLNFTGGTTGGAVALAVGDVTGDGWPDIIATHGVNLGYSIVPGNGGGGFLPSVRRNAGEEPDDVEITDIDGDGLLDLVLANQYSIELTVHINMGGGDFVPQSVYPAISGSDDMAMADVDNDGDLDVAITSYPLIQPSEGDITILHNDGAGAFRLPDTYHCPQTPMAVRLRDLNGDGFLDLLWCDHPNAPPYNFHTRMNLGDGTFGGATTWWVNGCGNGDVEAFDADDDDDLDVFLSDYLGCAGGGNDDVIYLSLNHGDGTFDPPSLLQFTLNPELIRHGDLNADGHDDLIVTTDGLEVRLGNGDGTFGPSLPAATPWGPKDVAVADLDGDGMLDIATANWGGDEGESMAALRGRGDGTFDAAITYAAGYSPNFGNTAGIGVADVDGDGDVDIAVGNYGSNDVSLFVNDGAGAFAPHVRYGLAARPVDLAMADVTGDGVPDVTAVTSSAPFFLADQVVVVKGLQQITGVTPADTRLSALVLNPAAPQPFSTHVTLTYSLPSAGAVSLVAFDLRGRAVATLVAASLPAGAHVARWDGRATDGRTLPNGVYVLRLSAGGAARAQRVTLMR